MFFGGFHAGALYLCADGFQRRETGRRLVFRTIRQASPEWRLARPVPLRGQRRDDDRVTAAPGNWRAVWAPGGREGGVMTAEATRAKIRELNDAFRTTLDHRLGRVMLTAGVNALPNDVKAMVI